MIWQMAGVVKNPLEFCFFIILIIFPLLFSLSFHEFSHGFVAYKFGDITPKIMGRLTLNPLKHLDVLGTVMLFIIGLGWAKPVIINPNNIDGETKRMLVALAGPMSNFFLAIVFALLIAILFRYQSAVSGFFITLFDAIVSINVALGVFNLIPLPPMDGSRIVSWLLPQNLKIIYNKLEPYGMFILMFMVFVVGFGGVFKLAKFLQHYMYHILGIL